MSEDRPLRGRKLADRRVRVDRPHQPFFRYAGPGQLVAREAASRPTTAVGRAWARLKSTAIGRPLANEEEIGERLAKKKALAIFSSDAISSSAYATEEILRVLLIAGAGAFIWSVEVAVAIALLLGVVSLSYRQVCRAYPSGGGAYVVARENLSQLAGLVAAAALLIDYVMTVAVSTASAVAQVVSVEPGLYGVRIEIGVAVIALITVANLRGLRESGNVFAIPTYLFIGLTLLMVGLGLVRVMMGDAAPVAPQPDALRAGTEGIGLLLLVRAFAGGSVALTGVEAIANGVPAFKPPEARNAAATMTTMAILLAVLFVGITVVADAYQIMPTMEGGQTVVVLLANAVFGGGSLLAVGFAVATALILFLAANTSFNAFPRLAAILAEDGFMPRQFSFKGDRLAFSWGIVLLGGIAAGLLVAFGGETHALIPLYSVGVFVCFTLSQIGMVRHWFSVREAGWRWRATINAVGAVLTAVVLIVVASVKFWHGAYLVVILIPILVAMMLFIDRQYRSTAAQLAVAPDRVVKPTRRDHRAVVPVAGIDRATIQAVNVARSISDDVLAIFIAQDPVRATEMRARWEAQLPHVPLVVIESPYRALTGPLLAYLEVLDRNWPGERGVPVTFVVVPEFVARTWWERLLYNQSVKRLRAALVGRPHTVVVDVPYRREDPESTPDTGRSAGGSAVSRPDPPAAT